MRLEGEVRVGLPVERAMHLFTPAGERLWVDGWDPHFPAGESGDGTEPGTVFVTAASGSETIWTVVERGERLVRYSRTSPGQWAGIVQVHCHPADDGTTRAVVTYELTALTDEARPELDEFAGGFADYMREWERLIAAALERSRSEPPA